jgi:uncharacterized protein YndB with AHSA1/START domain
MSDDIVRSIDALTREVRDETFQGKSANVVVASRTYDTDIHDLWDAITNAERLPRWFVPVSGKLEIGGQYQLEGNASGTVTRCEPPRELALTWEFGGGVSWVEVSLREEGAVARLQLRHIAYPDAHWEQFGPGAAGIGWELGLMELDKHIADPTAARPAEADPSWLESPEAKRFMGLSSDGWAQADIASGADKIHAIEAAERTRKFYCGET